MFDKIIYLLNFVELKVIILINVLVFYTLLILLEHPLVVHGSDSIMKGTSRNTAS